MRNKKLVYFTSDTHYGHTNSIMFDKRPFRDLAHMHSVLINNYNSTVPKDGICYFLGDFGILETAKAIEIVEQLNGIKVMILGNHDKGINAMYNIGFDIVLNAAELWIARERVTMSHCPLRGVFREDVSDMKGAEEDDNWHGESKHLEFSVADNGQFHLHGHIHSPNGGKSIKMLDRQMDIGVVANNYRPVSISAIESWISKRK